MTPEAQRKAIAEACGFQRMPSCNGVVRPDGVWLARTEPYEEVLLRICPDYLDDLNAMHAAERGLTAAQLNKYAASVLPTICAHSGHYDNCATADQRAEAFLRTIGKWAKP